MNVTLRGRSRPVRTVTFDADKNAVQLIEQRLLPHQFKIISTRDFRATAAAITDMIVRGAGAIGATAAYGLAQGAREFRGDNPARFAKHLATVFQTLKDARPTAVDPVNAMLQVRAAMKRGRTVAEQQALALAAKFADRMLDHGVYVIGFSYPVVPKDKARIRTQISAAHSHAELETAINAFAAVKCELGI